MKRKRNAIKLLFIALPLITGVLLAQRTSSPTVPASNPTANFDMTFVKIEPGEFMMGCSADDNACNADEKPSHRVRITKPFEIGKYEVTQLQWKAIMSSNPSVNIGDDHPVESMTKGEAQDFLNKLNARNDGYRYRLPTEAEWEYAARAGTTGPYAGKLDEIAWYAGNSGDESHSIGTKKPNAWGIYDMEGNVREWVADLYSANYYSSSPTDDPTGPAPGQRGGGRGGRGGPGGRGQPTNPTPPAGIRGEGDPLDLEPGQRRGGFPPGGPRGARDGRGGGRGQLPVMRGGGWDNPERFVRVSSRYNYYGDTLRVSDLGFRAARERIVN
jgi:formylglycine-generating enzyme required for sulfatase activity